MKLQNKPIVLFSILVILFSSCSTSKNTITLSSGKKIDSRLIGVWKGSENGKQIANLTKEWEMKRNSDGTFTINFTTISDSITDEFEESGNWWIKGKKFYEYHDDSKETDIYNYTILNEEQVKFKMIKTDIDFAEENYTFVDTKISTKTNNDTKKDGLSLETALKVQNIKEEYEYVRSQCINCQVLGQALLQHKGKPYDKLTLKNGNGEEISYYFDISSFFGKW
ncbi:hypothetical protein [Flavobacterium sp. WC2430]|uniref:hypothetical protein n=1 Tax=Flavobacterium sp. WC2430 TaxID=3234137 RepID=UPI003465588A